MNAPIIIFTYNRIENLKKLILSLKKNPEYKNSKIYVFIDGPKNQKDKIKTDKIFKYLNKSNTSSTQKIFYRNKNLGSAKNIMLGIDHVSKKESEFIVLEEDLIVSDEFLYFCNKMLKFYKDEKKIWHINGWVFDNFKSNEKFFFSKHMSCWGWATWSNRWKKFKKIKKKNAYFLISKKFRKEFEFLSLGSSLGLFLNYKKKINTWAVYWYYTIFLSKGITITPYKTLVLNTGFKLNSENTKINYYNKQKIIKNNLKSKLKLKKPVLNVKVLEKINERYQKKNFLLKNFMLLKENLYKIFL